VGQLDAASDNGDPRSPMGLRLRLKSSVDISRLPAQARISRNDDGTA
jgi:hypothetical protein